MKDLLGLAKILPLKKLIEVISQGVGKVTKSYFDRKDIETRALEIRELAKANADAIKTLDEAFENAHFNANLSLDGSQLSLTTEPKNSSQSTLEIRTTTRQNYLEQRRQLNIEEITAIAAENLRSQTNVADEKVDVDWINRFFSIAGDISTSQMQELWGRILAGEVKQPGSFSLRTLDVIRNLSKVEAELFTKFATLRLYAEGECFVYHDETLFKTHYKISTSQLMLLADAGLIQPNTDIILNFKSADQDPDQLLFKQGKRGILAKGPFNTLNHIEVLKFTVAGTEIAALIPELEDDFHFFTVCKAITISSNVTADYGLLDESENNITGQQPFQKAH